MKTILVLSALALCGCNNQHQNGDVAKIKYTGNVCVRVITDDGSSSIVLEGIARGRSCRTHYQPIGAPGDTVLVTITETFDGTFDCE